MLKYIIHWLIGISVALQLLLILFRGELRFPDMPW